VTDNGWSDRKKPFVHLLSYSDARSSLDLHRCPQRFCSCPRPPPPPLAPHVPWRPAAAVGELRLHANRRLWANLVSREHTGMSSAVDTGAVGTLGSWRRARPRPWRSLRRHELGGRVHGGTGRQFTQMGRGEGSLRADRGSPARKNARAGGGPWRQGGKSAQRSLHRTRRDGIWGRRPWRLGSTRKWLSQKIEAVPNVLGSFLEPEFEIKS
jgi:hypothetical protein